MGSSWFLMDWCCWHCTAFKFFFEFVPRCCRACSGFSVTHGESCNVWHRHGSQKHNKTKNRYSQPKPPSTGSPGRSNTGCGLHRNVTSRFKSHNTYKVHQPCVRFKCIWPSLSRPSCANASLLSVNATQCLAGFGGSGALEL